MNTENRINNTIAEMRNILNESGVTEQYYELLETLPDLILNAEESGDIETCEVNSLKVALRLCRKINKIRDRWDEILEYIKENIQEGMHIDTWIRGLTGVRVSQNKKINILKELMPSKIYYKVYKAIEKEADFRPSDQLMEWYVALLERGIGSPEEKVFQRLAFYYIHSKQWDEQIDKAKAYLLAMERRGILPDNPYGGYFGQYDHSELIRAILNDTYEENLMQMRTEYAHGLLEEVHRNGFTGEIEQDAAEDIRSAWIENQDWDDLRNIMFTCYDKLRHNRRSDGDHAKRDLDIWDAYLMKFCSTIEYCLDRKEEPAFAKAGQLMLQMLHNGDSWLLRYIELKTGTDKEYYKQEIVRWIDILQDIAVGNESLILDGLYNTAIRLHQEAGDQKAATEILKEKVYSCDSQCEFLRAGVEIANELHNRVWCTHNAMALIYQYEKDGYDEGVSEVASLIRETEEAFNIDEAVRMTYDDWHIKLMEKYIVLLETIDRQDEAYWWRQRRLEITNGDPDECRMLYRQGRIKESLTACEKQAEARNEHSDTDYEKRISLLKYLINNNMTEVTESTKTAATLNHSSIAWAAGHECGLFFGSISYQDWKRFSASIDSMASSYSHGCDPEDEKEVLPPEEYLLQYCFLPFLSKGDGSYIHYLYKEGSESFSGII